MKREPIHDELQKLIKIFLKNKPDGARELARAFDVSLPTIRRWADGTNFPHRFMCPSIIEYLRRISDGL